MGAPANHPNESPRQPPPAGGGFDCLIDQTEYIFILSSFLCVFYKEIYFLHIIFHTKTCLFY